MPSWHFYFTCWTSVFERAFVQAIKCRHHDSGASSLASANLWDWTRPVCVYEQSAKGKQAGLIPWNTSPVGCIELKNTLQELKNTLQKPPALQQASKRAQWKRWLSEALQPEQDPTNTHAAPVQPLSPLPRQEQSWLQQKPPYQVSGCPAGTVCFQPMWSELQPTLPWAQMKGFGMPERGRQWWGR